MLSKVYWLGGSPCAGKTTISVALAKRFHWNIYHCDDYFADHRQRSNPIDHPTFYRISRLQDDALWLRDQAEMVRSEPLFFADQFKMVIEDLKLFNSELPVLVEGSPVLPHLLKSQLLSKHHAFWLLPTETFQRSYYARRSWIHDYLKRTSDPAQAFENWMVRDASFARWLQSQVISHDMHWLLVDGFRSLDETIELAAKYFQSE